MTSRDIDIALQHARCAIEDIQDHFNRDPVPRSPAGLSPALPMAQTRFDDARRSPFHDYTEEIVRWTNLAVSLANQNIHPKSQFTLVQPTICRDGSFPADFRAPKTMEAVKLFDNSQLNRILQEYKLPYDSRTLLDLSKTNLRMTREVLTSSKLRSAKLKILFEYFGAMRVVEDNRMRRGLEC